MPETLQQMFAPARLFHVWDVQSHQLRLEYARQVLADVERKLGVTPVTREEHRG